jgi:putative SOS response-associated peptidase YedK
LFWFSFFEVAMCGRFTLHHAGEEIAERFGVQQVLFPLEPRYNIAPSQPVAVVLEQDEGRCLDAYKWGLVPFWAKDPKIGNRMINARAETLAEKPSFRAALTRRRCLIPADGFYEWKKEGDARRPFHIRLRDGKPFAFAGLYEEWQAPDGAPLRTCAIITVEPNPLMAQVHNRMPAILDADAREAWLDPALKDAPRLQKLLTPYPEQEMEAYPVSRRVNAPTFDGPECIRPARE